MALSHEAVTLAPVAFNGFLNSLNAAHRAIFAAPRHNEKEKSAFANLIMRRNIYK
jgi:hypothetical protein